MSIIIGLFGNRIGGSSMSLKKALFRYDIGFQLIRHFTTRQVWLSWTTAFPQYDNIAADMEILFKRESICRNERQFCGIAPIILFARDQQTGAALKNKFGLFQKVKYFFFGCRLPNHPRISWLYCHSKLEISCIFFSYYVFWIGIVSLLSEFSMFRPLL